MAEFLIYNKDHWCDALTEKQIKEYVKKYPKFMDKYNARIQRGDVIEVRPDGYWTGPKAPGYDKSVFLLVTKPGLSLEDAKQYQKALYGEETFTQVWLEKQQRFESVSDVKIVKKRKYNFTDVTDKQIISDFSEITITEK